MITEEIPHIRERKTQTDAIKETHSHTHTNTFDNGTGKTKTQTVPIKGKHEHHSNIIDTGGKPRTGVIKGKTNI